MVRENDNKALTEYEIVAVKTSREDAVNIRAIGIVANALKARVSFSLTHPDTSGALSLEPTSSSAKVFQLGNEHFLPEVLPVRSR